MWKLFQFSIFFAVIASDIQYEWGAGPLVAPFIGFTLAYSASCILAWVIDLFRKRDRDRNRSALISAIPLSRPVQAASLMAPPMAMTA